MRAFLGASSGALTASDGDRPCHSLRLMVAYRAVPLVLARLVEVRHERGGLPRRDLLGLDLARRTFDLERMRNLPNVLHLELDDAGLVDRRVLRVDLHLALADSDRRRGPTLRRVRVLAHAPSEDRGDRQGSEGGHHSVTPHGGSSSSRALGTGSGLAPHAKPIDAPQTDYHGARQAGQSVRDRLPPDKQRVRPNVPARRSFPHTLRATPGEDGPTSRMQMGRPFVSIPASGEDLA